MRKILLYFVLISFLLTGIITAPCPIAKANEEKVKLAIVIDDFGEDRNGVEEMLALQIPLTVAVMPGMEYSKEDAQKAHSAGHEVILHMPMENLSFTPDYYYGSMVIRNNFSESEAVEMVKKALETVPYATGMNIHMGTGVSRNKNLISAMMTYLKGRNMFFLDSKTIEGSVCPEMATKTGIKFFERDIFLEPPGRPNKAVALTELEKAVAVAKEKGFAVVIGHVGPVGRNETAQAIAESIERMQEEGVEFVRLSDLNTT